MCGISDTVRRVGNFKIWGSKIRRLGYLGTSFLLSTYAALRYRIGDECDTLSSEVGPRNRNEIREIQDYYGLN